MRGVAWGSALSEEVLARRAPQDRSQCAYQGTGIGDRSCKPLVERERDSSGTVPTGKSSQGGPILLRRVLTETRRETHRLGTFRSYLVSSVTSRVSHDAKRPYGLRPNAETEAAADVPRKILCAIDRSRATRAVVRWTVEPASSIGARLHLLHAVGPVSDWPTLESERRLQEQVRKDARQKITSVLKEAGVDLFHCAS